MESGIIHLNMCQKSAYAWKMAEEIMKDRDGYGCDKDSVEYTKLMCAAFAGCYRTITEMQCGDLNENVRKY